MNKKVDWIEVGIIVATAGICMCRIGSRAFECGVKFAVDSLNREFEEQNVVFTRSTENEHAIVSCELKKKKRK